MRYVQLRAFHHVAIHKGFSLAAEALHVTQPAISDQVRKLESEYDIKLFNRSKKQITLTPDGQALLDITHRLFEVEQRAEQFLGESRARRTGTLRIIADSALHMTQVLARFRLEFPDVFIVVSSGNSEQVVNQLEHYEADIGVVGNLPADNKHDIVELESTPIIAFAPSGSQYAKFTSVSLQKLTRWPLVLREQGSRTRARIEEQAAISRLPLNVVIEAEGREAVRQIVSDGGGVGIVSEAEYSAGDSLKKIRIRDTNLTMQEAIVCLKERRDNQLIDRFMTLASSV